MSNEQIGGDLIGYGSFGCVFKPALNCPGDTDVPDDAVSKVFYGKDGKRDAKEELGMDKIIRGIKGHEQWSHSWHKMCKPSNYDDTYNIDPSIESCLDMNNISESDYDRTRTMLQGSDAGTPFLDLMTNKFKSSTFSNKETFRRNFLYMMKMMKPLFLGLKAMYHSGLSHNDIKDENIMVDKDGCKYIDFGFACEFKNKKFYENRSKTEWWLDRIYPTYPYEFIFLYAYGDLLEEEKRDIQEKIYRSLHDRYVLVHDQIFGRKTHEYLLHLVDRIIKDGPKIRNGASGKDITSLIDTYSVGMLIPGTLCKISKKHGSVKKLIKLVGSDKVKSFMDLFKDMTEPDHSNRMKPDEAYTRYLELEKLYLSPKEVRRKRTRRK